MHDCITVSPAQYFVQLNFCIMRNLAPSNDVYDAAPKRPVHFGNTLVATNSLLSTKILLETDSLINTRVLNTEKRIIASSIVAMTQSSKIAANYRYYKT